MHGTLDLGAVGVVHLHADAGDAAGLAILDVAAVRAANATGFDRAEGVPRLRLRDRPSLVRKGIKVVERDFTSETDYIRHDPRKLARTIEDFASGWIR